MPLSRHRGVEHHVTDSDIDGVRVPFEAAKADKVLHEHRR